MAANPFSQNNPENLIIPASVIKAVTPSDTVNLPGGVCRALWVGTAGAADIIDASGNLCATFPLLQGCNPIGVTRINLTNLAASNIWALY